jgi:hypothetical protein
MPNPAVFNKNFADIKLFRFHEYVLKIKDDPFFIKLQTLGTNSAFP